MLVECQCKEEDDAEISRTMCSTHAENRELISLRSDDASKAIVLIKRALKKSFVSVQWSVMKKKSPKHSSK
jgi:hypothetical protein